MNKKEMREALECSLRVEQIPLRAILLSILDALPETEFHVLDTVSGRTFPYTPGDRLPVGCVKKDGPEPVEVKESQPTSASMTEMTEKEAREWKHWAGVRVRRTDSGYFEPSVEEGLSYETELITLNKFRQMLARKARFGSSKEYDEARDADLGPQQPPNVAGATGAELVANLEAQITTLKVINGIYKNQLDVVLGRNQRGDGETSGATQPPKIEPPVLCSQEDARKLRIMKAMEDHCAKHKDATFSCYYGDQWALITKGPPSCANFDFWKTQAEIDVAYEESERKIRARKEEQRIDKEIAEVKAKADVLVRKCDKLVDLARYAARQLRDNDAASVARTISVQLDYILGNQPEPPATGGVPATPESAAEKLWEDEIWVNPGSGQVRQQERGDCEKDYHYSGWRRIKVREVR